VRDISCEHPADILILARTAAGASLHLLNKSNFSSRFSCDFCHRAKTSLVRRSNDFVGRNDAAH
jgi:hypothetical protein